MSKNNSRKFLDGVLNNMGYYQQEGEGALHCHVCHEPLYSQEEDGLSALMCGNPSCILYGVLVAIGLLNVDALSSEAKERHQIHFSAKMISDLADVVVDKLDKMGVLNTVPVEIDQELANLLESKAKDGGLTPTELVSRLLEEKYGGGKAKNMNDPKKVIYTSSYDRGLEHLLKMWSDVKEAVPEAELHIYYGWTLFKRFYGDNPERMDWMKRMNDMMEQPGVVHHGRVPQDVLHEKMKECGIWAYPTHFGEISCITAMKAQALGCIPVVVNYAALQTTVQHGVKVDGDIHDKETKEKFKKELIDLLKNPKLQEDLRGPMMKWAKKEFSWARIAKQWSKEFKKGENGKKSS